MSDRPRKPRTFTVPGAAAEPAASPAPKPRARKPKTKAPDRTLVLMPDEAAQRLPPQLAEDIALADELTPSVTPVRSRRFSWGKLALGTAAALASLAFGLWIDSVVRALFSRYDALGWIALGLTALLVLAAIAVVVREISGLRSMERISDLRADALRAVETDDAVKAKTVTKRLGTLYADRADLRDGRTALAAHDAEIIDGADLIGLTERDLMAPLDRRATALVMASSKRVSLVTAVSPRALVDVAYVLVETTRLIRALAELYGGRPGKLGFLRLARNVIGHLAVTGSIAVGDGLVQQVVGHGVAARISSRLGEGVVNGLLTARIGISAMDICRPLPFSQRHRPSVGDFMSELVKFGAKDTGDDAHEVKN